ncbi:alpha/beta hydrolase family esterase [Roseovarius autotrophicus]|uniref:alpha/beta hydrolase family esterase n=1 Tax=Roseovarius autotrophicus TaxID=2824121 RepID=UPI0019DC9775|nr:alpha/beta hydrolase-fold protein [Roseovarius autotrophicus]MBE0453392.1 polyhydroxybutyrate depolymerase [Roseovarius sp.]
MRLVSLVALCLGLATPAMAQSGCGTDLPCDIPSGGYRIALPEGKGPFPVVLFLHGYGGSATGTMRGGMARAAQARGYAFIVPEALVRPGRNRTSWGFHPDFPGPRNEADFLQEVMQDASARFGIDPTRSLLTGFSIGGSLASYIACARPDDFTAYAPVSGSFWRPHPEGCAGPVRLLHTHGWRDQVVPLEGREIRPGFVQGDVFHAMDLWRTANACARHYPDKFETDGDFWRRVWLDCAPGSALELALFDGGHGMPRGWSNMALDWFEAQIGPTQ